jgi:transcriptional regulator with XRE-family HTH domain
MARPSPSFAGDSTLVAVGAAIRAARQKAGLSQEVLAADSGLDRSHVGGIERGEHNITLISLVRIAGALNCSGADLLSAAKI